MQREECKIEYYQLQLEAGLSNREASSLFDVSIRSIEKWRVEKPKAPKAVILCLKSMVKNKPVSNIK